MKNNKSSLTNLLSAIGMITTVSLLAAVHGQAATVSLSLSGYNADTIVDASGSSANNVAGDYTFYDAGFAGAYYPGDSGALSGAFPAGETAAGTSGNVYAFAPDTGNEDLINQGTLTLTTPLEATSLYVLGTSSGTTTDSYTLTFAGGATATGTISFADWYDPSATGEINGLSRVEQGSPSTLDTDHPASFSLYDSEILIPVADQDLALESIAITGTSGANNSNIFAINATPTIPEPSTYGLVIAGIGVLALVARLRRQNSHK